MKSLIANRRDLRTTTATPRPDGTYAISGTKIFNEGKVAACRWFFGWELPAIEHPLSRLAALDPTCLEVRPRQL